MNLSIYKRTFKIISAITLVTALVFLCPNIAKAESPVQPLQVVTYSDTSTQLRISGTAERLHYNVDSFQVVFTNPPNNYGTACTPVLVSFRFYNSSDTPAYVGQAEFEIICTNGTGSTNLIIYGYDQISTDLFIAESTYSTSEVGRIGIGASNDFAYYTGFVVPPKTSLYFSAIVYVNASAYEGVSNVTGSQEQVNQLTMSSLNLYTNQISFSDAYPYHNQPIDFSSIIQEISDLSDTVSTSSEMQSLIDAVTYSGSAYTGYLGAYYRKTTNYTGTTGLTFRTSRSLLRSYYITDDIELNTTNDTIVEAGSICFPVIISTYWKNSTSNDYRINFLINLNEIVPPNVSFEIISHESNYCGYFYESDRNLYLTPNNGDNTYSYLKAGQYGYSVTRINFYIPVDYNITNIDNWNNGNNWSVVFGTPSVASDSFAHESNIFGLLRNWINSYNKVNGIDDSSDISNDVSDVSDSNHIIEESYYSANASAIEATGLSNYRFSNEQNNGIGKVADDFMLLWNALGSWNGVYVFSLTMALATFIMRHGGLFTVRRETSDKGGDGD